MIWFKPLTAISNITIDYVEKTDLKNGGEGGIRTRGRDKPYTAFPRLLDKPLRHLSKIIYNQLFTLLSKENILL
jgi:hypothetical protein